MNFTKILQSTCKSGSEGTTLLKPVPHYDDDVIMVEMVDGPILLHPSHCLITPEEGTRMRQMEAWQQCVTLRHHPQLSCQRTFTKFHSAQGRPNLESSPRWKDN